MCNLWVNVFTCDVCEEWSNCGVYWTVGDDEDRRHVGGHSGTRNGTYNMGHMVRLVRGLIGCLG